MSTQAQREYLEALWKQYKKAGRALKTQILDEICRNLGVHRKTATRLMCCKYRPRSLHGHRGGRRRNYTEAAKEHLARLWRMMGYMGPVRMKSALPMWLPHDDVKGCDESVKSEIVRMSASTIGRLLKQARAELHRRMQSGTHRGLRKFITQVPIRNLGETPRDVGHCEADCVAHCGGSLSGNFVWSVNLTDIATGWTEVEAIWIKDKHHVMRALKAIERRLPFKLKALYFDNGSEFMNDQIIEKFAKEGRAEPLPIFRGRPYRKNDQCYIEQKNYTHVRHLWGYCRIDWKKAVNAMNDVYRKEWRLLQNFFMPQQKLENKVRVGAKVFRRMSSPATPFARLRAHLSPDRAQELDGLAAVLNPFHCRHALRAKIRRLLREAEIKIPINEWGKIGL